MTDRPVTLITGAAGGMGMATARVMADNGHDLILCDRDAVALQAVADELPSATDVQTCAGDITDAAIDAAFIAAMGGRRLALFAHTAGVSPSMADGRRVMAVNFTATRRLTQALVPHLAPGGVIVLIASNSGQLIAGPRIDRAVQRMISGKFSLLAALLTRHPRGAYPLSKRAVQLFAQNMAGVVGAAGGRILSLSPGIIDTAMGRLEHDAGPEMARMIALTPLARAGQAAEIAHVIQFLASPAASYLHGTDILVDGGTVAGIQIAGGLRSLRG